MTRVLRDLLVAIQFLTRVPVPKVDFQPDSLACAAKFFPLVGLGIGAGGVLVRRLAAQHLVPSLSALLVLTFFVVITSGLHEDGLADAVDGFGGGWSPEQVLAIMRDSRIGSFGAIAITLSLLARFLLLSNLPPARFLPYVISAHVLCRWTTLPLGYFLRSARTGEGQGGLMAERIPGTALAIGSVIAFAVVGYFLRTDSWIPIAAATVIAALTGLYYQKRIGGVTGDCFGAANQLTEIAIYFCGVWRA